MFSAIRRRVTYANVVVTLALVFAMSGGAYAASRYVITSAKQIKPSVLKSLQGRAGTSGAQGPAGPAGAAGLAGPAGAKGEPGAPGKEGPPGKNGENGKDGTTGFTKTLPPEATETGVWTGYATAGSSTEIVVTPISFNIPLEGELEAGKVHIVDKNGNGSTCPGTAAEPAASPGNLCVYIGENEAELGEIKAINKPSTASAEAEAGAGRSGAWLYITPKSGDPLALMYGSWAVSAPEAT
jgi:hypothetical protein